MSNSQKYCNFYSYLKKHNKQFAELAIDDLCLEGLMKSKSLNKNGRTLLNPSSKMVDELQKMVDNGDFDEATIKAKSLFIEGEFNEKTIKTKVVTFNSKEVDGSKLEVSTPKAKFTPIEGLKYSVVDIKDFPKEGETVSKAKMEKSESKKGSKENNTRVQVTNDLINEYIAQKNKHTFSYHVNSLLTFIKNKDSALYGKIHKLIDPNMILTWYILVQPTMKANAKHIPDSLFNKWAQSNFKNPIKSVELIKELMSSNNYDNKELKQIVEKRKAINDNGLAEVIKEVMKLYNNPLKLLEDELRFRFSDEPELSHDDILSLNLIDWDQPKKSMILFVDKLPKSNLLRSELYKLLTKFIRSNAFLYTPYNDDVVKKIKSTISGAGSSSKSALYICGSSNRDEIQQMPAETPLEFSLEDFVNSLSEAQKAELKSYL